MKISYTVVGTGMKVTSALREAVIRCFDRTLAHCTVSPTVDAVLCFKQHKAKENQNTVTVTVKADGKKQIVRTATTDDMYKSIDQVSEKVGREIARRKEQNKKSPRTLIDQPLPESSRQKKVA